MTKCITTEIAEFFMEDWKAMSDPGQKKVIHGEFILQHIVDNTDEIMDRIETVLERNGFKVD